jgi:hypothetical protein
MELGLNQHNKGASQGAQCDHTLVSGPNNQVPNRRQTQTHSHKDRHSSAERRAVIPCPSFCAKESAQHKGGKAQEHVMVESTKQTKHREACWDTLAGMDTSVSAAAAAALKRERATGLPQYHNHRAPGKVLKHPAADQEAL